MAEEHNQALLSMSVEAVFVRRQAYFQNGYRPFPVYSPSAVNRDGQPILNAGKRAKGKNWREAAAEDPPRAVRPAARHRRAEHRLFDRPTVGIDIDVPDQSLVDRVTAVIEKILTATPLVRQGQPQKPRCSFAPRRCFEKDHAEAAVPGCGRQQADPRRMPGERAGSDCRPDRRVTGKPYRWLAEHPLYVRLEDLPTVTEDQVVAVLTAAEAILREAGLVDCRWIPTHRSKNRLRSGCDQHATMAQAAPAVSFTALTPRR